jgi:hypothetical protein
LETFSLDPLTREVLLCTTALILTTVTVWQFHERLANDCKRR